MTIQLKQRDLWQLRIGSCSNRNHGLKRSPADKRRCVQELLKLKPEWSNPKLAERAGVAHIVAMSSAAVYGARPDNAVPLTEAAPLRPNEGFAFAAAKAETEDIVGAWVKDRGGRTATLLRPALTPAPSGLTGWLFRTVRPGLGERVVDAVPAMQFVHIDDVATAVLHAASERLDGAFNVAPDGWLNGEEAAAMLGPTLSLPVTGRPGDVLVQLSQRAADLVRKYPQPAGAGPLGRYPWVVSNDRLRSTGWAPRSTSQEALVASRRPSRVSALFARRRQEVTLAVVSIAALIGLGVAAMVVRRLRRRT